MRKSLPVWVFGCSPPKHWLGRYCVKSLLKEIKSFLSPRPPQEDLAKEPYRTRPPQEDPGEEPYWLFFFLIPNPLSYHVSKSLLFQVETTTLF